MATSMATPYKHLSATYSNRQQRSPGIWTIVGWSYSIRITSLHNTVLLQPLTPQGATAAETTKAVRCGCSHASSCHQSHRSGHSRQQHLLHRLAGHSARQIGQRQHWGQRLHDPRGHPKQPQAPCEVQDPTAGASVWMPLSAGPPCSS